MLSHLSVFNGFLSVFLLCAVCYEELYAFSYNPKQNDQQREEGWQLIDLGAEFERMGVPCDQWQLTDVNRDYKVGSKIQQSPLPTINCIYLQIRNIGTITVIVVVFVIVLIYYLL